MTQTPSVGRIVHYTATGYADEHSKGPVRGTPIAAIITEQLPDDESWVGLHIFWPVCSAEEPMGPDGPHYRFAEEPTPGHWSWPPRV